MDLPNELSHCPDKEQIHRLTNYIGDDPKRFAELINCILHGDDAVSKYGSWLLGHCMRQYPHLVKPHLAALINNLHTPGLHDSVRRGTVKALAEVDEIPETLQGYALQHCFDMLLNPKTAVAIQVHAMQTAFNISQNEPDLLRELQTVIEEGMPLGTAGYRSRGGKILQKISQLLQGR